MKRITLTFDNGPHLSGTPHILETLAARSLKATFCLVGERLREPALRALALRAKAEGHRIANHTMTHGAPLGRRSGEHVPEEEIGAAQAMLGDLAERRLFRPNDDEGLLSEFVLSEAAVDYLALHRYTVISRAQLQRAEHRRCPCDHQSKTNNQLLEHPFAQPGAHNCCVPETVDRDMPARLPAIMTLLQSAHCA